MAELLRCYRHPDRETGVSCSDCGRGICTDCMVFAPVGIRCPDHSGQPQGAAKVVQKVQRSTTRNPGFVTTTLIGINVGIYLLQLAGGASVNANSGWIFEHGALVVTAIGSNGELVASPRANGGGCSPPRSSTTAPPPRHEHAGALVDRSAARELSRPRPIPPALPRLRTRRLGGRPAREHRQASPSVRQARFTESSAPRSCSSARGPTCSAAARSPC